MGCYTIILERSQQVKEAEAAASSQASTPTQLAEAPATQSPSSPLSPDTKYCIICTILGKICPNEYPMSSDWDKDLKEQEWKNQEAEDQKAMRGRHPKQALNLHHLIPLFPNPPNPQLNS